MITEEEFENWFTDDEFKYEAAEAQFLAQNPQPQFVESEGAALPSVTYNNTEVQPTVPLMRAWGIDEVTLSGPTQWLAIGLIPRGAVTVFVGAEGIGKSLWWVCVASRITTGVADPLLKIPKRDPADVLLILTEQSLDEDVERLKVANANLKRVRFFNGAADGSETPVFPRDYVPLANTLAAADGAVAAIFVDVFADTVEGRLTLRDPQQARQALHGWHLIARKFDVAVVLVTHTNRQSSDDLRDMVGLTGALRQKARSFIFAIRPQGDDRRNQLFVGADKSNHADINSAVEYHIEACQVRAQTDDDPGSVPRLVPIADAGLSIRELHQQWRKEQSGGGGENISGDSLRALEYVRQHEGVHYYKSVAEALSLNPNSVRTQLNRHYNAGRIAKPKEGHYCSLEWARNDPESSVPGVASVAGVADSRATPATPATVLEKNQKPLQLVPSPSSRLAAQFQSDLATGANIIEDESEVA